MRNLVSPFLLTIAVCVITGMGVAQVEIKRVIPRSLSLSAEERGLRQRIERILGREVQYRFEYEAFIHDLTSLGRNAVPSILELTDENVADRYVTESLLRIGGPHVRRWLAAVMADQDANWRQAFLAGVPVLRDVDGSVRPDLAAFLHDRSPQVRVLALQKFHTLIDAAGLIRHCRDLHRDVIRTAISVVSDRWLFLDHGTRELQNLEAFVGILATHVEDDRWQVGRSFTKAFHKERIARTKLGRELRKKIETMPWFHRGAADLTDEKLATIRAELRKSGADQVVVLERVLGEMPAVSGAELLLVLAEEDDKGIRLATCDAGLRLLDRQLAPSFMRFLKDPDDEVRAKARQLLEQTAFYADQRKRWGAETR